MIKFLAVVTPEKVFLSYQENFTGKSISSLFFDGNKPMSTFKPNWIKLDSFPTQVQSLREKKTVIVGYQLKDDYIATDTMPKHLDEDFFYSWAISEEERDEEDHPLFRLYDPIIETQEETLKIEEFEITEIATKESGWEFVRIPFPGIKHHIIDEITTHPSLLQDKACSISSHEAFSIIRNHIKHNIDGRFAKITSDYDFCFSVEKIIPLPYKEKEINYSTKGKKEVSYRVNRKVKLFDMAPKPYQDYPVIQAFSGLSYDDLDKNVKEYLSDLMDKINQPLTDCPHCNGLGVVLSYFVTPHSKE